MSSNPPYFEILFSRLAAGDPRTVAAFGRHVHWGYWPDPAAASGTAEDYGDAAERLCQKVCDAAGIRGGEKILDVGCGFGGTIASLNERFSNLELTGVNIDPRQLDRAAQTVQPQNGNATRWLEADAARLPLSDAAFDVVLAVECIFHFDRPRFLAEAARVLRPGGCLALSDFVPDERAADYLSGAALAADVAIRWSYGQIDLGCSVSRYRELAASCGLTLANVSDITPHTLPTYDFLNASTADWPDPTDIALFRRATARLEKASRKGLLGYKILRLEK
jgi:ubiquinone/menaquinone biosynthesis C-methylase UbiE